MSFLGLSGPETPSPPEPPRDPDSETVGLPPELGDKTPLGRLVRFLIAAVLGGLFAVPLTLIPAVAVDVSPGLAGPGVKSVVAGISSYGVTLGLCLGLVSGCAAVVWGDRYLASLFRYLRRQR